VGELAARTCVAQTSTTEPSLPNVVDGVYFLKMGYPECLHFYGDTPTERER
jgi:hypothetical protein